MITYESICKKLGFDFMKSTGRSVYGDCDDINPYKCLTLEETIFMLDYMDKYLIEDDNNE